jgi:hypothetical protein
MSIIWAVCRFSVDLRGGFPKQPTENLVGTYVIYVNWVELSAGFPTQPTKNLQFTYINHKKPT